MACYNPLEGFRSKLPGPSGKRGITFNRSDGFTDLPIKVPCGQCIGCRLEKSRQWAMRCVDEASLYDKNCFITLTYDNDNLPRDLSLDLTHFQKFMKRLRKRYGNGIRFYHCGEYGEQNLRPHYHAILFNFDFPDKIHFKTENDNRLYISDGLANLWPYGFSILGDVSFQSAAYVARYCVKKINGKDADEHYTRQVVDENGEVIEHKVKPEYATMSRRPGIGQDWLKKFKTDAYPSDFIVRNGVKMKPPAYYDRQLELEDPELIRSIKAARKRSAAQHAENNTPARLAVREKVQQLRARQLKRNLENGT